MPALPAVSGGDLRALPGGFAAADFELAVGDHLQQLRPAFQAKRSRQIVEISQTFRGFVLAQVEGDGLGLFALFLVHTHSVSRLARAVKLSCRKNNFLTCGLSRRRYNLSRLDSTSDLNAKTRREPSLLHSESGLSNNLDNERGNAGYPLHGSAGLLALEAAAFVSIDNAHHTAVSF